MRKSVLVLSVLFIFALSTVGYAQDKEVKINPLDSRSTCAMGILDWAVEGGFEMGAVSSMGLFKKPASVKYALTSGFTMNMSLCYHFENSRHSLGAYYGYADGSQISSQPMYQFSYYRNQRFGLMLRSLELHRGLHSIETALQLGAGHIDLYYPDYIPGKKPKERWGLDLEVSFMYNLRLFRGNGIGIRPFARGTYLFGNAGDGAIEKPDGFGSVGVCFSLRF